MATARPGRALAILLGPAEMGCQRLRDRPIRFLNGSEHLDDDTIFINDFMLFMKIAFTNLSKTNKLGINYVLRCLTDAVT
jgi:hypothetical protein